MRKKEAKNQQTAFPNTFLKIKETIREKQIPVRICWEYRDVDRWQMELEEISSAIRFNVTGDRTTDVAQTIDYIERNVSAHKRRAREMGEDNVFRVAARRMSFNAARINPVAAQPQEDIEMEFVVNAGDQEGNEPINGEIVEAAPAQPAVQYAPEHVNAADAWEDGPEDPGQNQ